MFGKLKDSAGNIIGITTKAVITKNRLGPPYREAELNASTSSLSSSFANEIDGLASTDEQTIELDTINNVIRLKETVAAPDSGTRTFEGNIIVTGSLTVTGSILVSGSIIPDTDGVSTTSSFDLGSPTAAWKDIYVSEGTINFLDSSGNVVSTVGTGNNQLTGDTFINGKLFQGNNVTASGLYSHAEGSGSRASGTCSHAEGRQTTSSGNFSHAEGRETWAQGEGSHAEGYQTFTQGGTAVYSHAEGHSTRVEGAYAHAEGSGSRAWSQFSHAEGINTYTYDPFAPLVTSNEPALGSHAEGEETITVGRASHAEGYQTFSSGSWSHAEGYGTYTAGDYSHAEGLGTVTAAPYQHASGKFNLLSFDENDLFAVGNGTSDGSRSNALTVKMSGSIALPTTQSSTPSWTGVDGEMVFATVTGNHYFYVWMAGAWRSGSLA